MGFTIRRTRECRGFRSKRLHVDNSSNVYVTGESAGQGTRNDFATVKYNSTGQEQWVVRYNGPANRDDQANAIAVDASGNVYVTGQSFDPNNGDDYVTIKYVQGATPTPTPTATPTGTPTPTEGHAHSDGYTQACANTKTPFNTAASSDTAALASDPIRQQHASQARPVDKRIHDHLAGSVSREILANHD